jgi:DNA-binding NarL/FixJ family response regulator
MTGNNTDTIHVAILDDDEEVRSGLSWLIDKMEGYCITGTYGTCHAALQKIDDNPPDVMLVDIGLPDRSGIECVRELKRHYPDIQFLMLTVYSDDDNIFQSLRAGAVGYLLKKTPSAKLIEAIRDARDGGAPISNEIARKVLQYFQEQPGSTHLTDRLSDRETEVLRCLTEGLSYKAIADRLFLSVHTVRFHLHNIYAKLHVTSRAEAVAKAMKSPTRPA